jgi:hypothetical protein
MLQHLPAGAFLAALLEKTRASVGAVELAGGGRGREAPAVERSAPDGKGASAESPEPARHGST